MKSIFILSIAPRMLVETLNICNCDEWKHIIIDTEDHDSIRGTVFPNLKELNVAHCMQLEYIIGHYNDDHQNDTENHLHLPALERFNICNLPSLVDMCPQQYHTTFPPLEELILNWCFQFSLESSSISDFMTHHSVTRSMDDTIIEELSGNVDHFLALKRLMVNNNSKVESIICLNEINEQQMNLDLQYIELLVLPMMTYIFVGPKNSFSLQNLARLTIKRCEKLKIVFSTVIRCLPQLGHMTIEKCKELEHIFEDDSENKNSSNFMSTEACFRKLKTLVVEKCNKLKYVFPISICKELPELQILMIGEADELEEIFVSEGDDHKVEIPNLEYVVFENLPTLCHAQGIQFQAVIPLQENM